MADLALGTLIAELVPAEAIAEETAAGRVRGFAPEMTSGGVAMMTPIPAAISRRRSAPPRRYEADGSGEQGSSLGGVPSAPHWVEPGTRHTYPLSYRAYRRTREAEEKPPPRHRGLGPEVDRYVWRHWRRLPWTDAEVLLTFRPDAPPRVQRIVAEILRAIRRGQPAGEAIRRVARRFGLRPTHVRAFITACVVFETQPQHDATSSAGPTHGPLIASIVGWL